jgi:hypothetical protein
MNLPLTDIDCVFVVFELEGLRTFLRREYTESSEDRLLDLCLNLTSECTLKLFEFGCVFGLDAGSDLEVKDDDLVDAIEGSFEVVGDDLDAPELVPVWPSLSGRQTVG